MNARGPWVSEGKRPLHKILHRQNHVTSESSDIATRTLCRAVAMTFLRLIVVCCLVLTREWCSILSFSAHPRLQASSLSFLFFQGAWRMRLKAQQMVAHRQLWYKHVDSLYVTRNIVWEFTNFCLFWNLLAQVFPLQ